MSDPLLDTSWLAVAPLEGDALWFNGALQNIKVPGEWSDDAFSLVEVRLAPGACDRPAHRPEPRDVLRARGHDPLPRRRRRALVQAGETVAIRRGVPHAFVVTSETARFLVLNTPGGQDRFFRDGGEPAPSRDLASAPPREPRAHGALCRDARRRHARAAAVRRVRGRSGRHNESGRRRKATPRGGADLPRAA